MAHMTVPLTAITHLMIVLVYACAPCAGYVYQDWDIESAPSEGDDDASDADADSNRPGGVLASFAGSILVLSCDICLESSEVAWFNSTTLKFLLRGVVC